MTSFTDRPHKPHSHSNNRPNCNLYITFIMSEPSKAGQTVSCVLTVAVVETRTPICKMTDGNGVAAMSREKLTRSRETRCASPFERTKRDDREMIEGDKQLSDARRETRLHIQYMSSLAR